MILTKAVDPYILEDETGEYLRSFFFILNDELVSILIAIYCL